MTDKEEFEKFYAGEEYLKDYQLPSIEKHIALYFGYLALEKRTPK